MKYAITEHATYEVEADSPREAMSKFLAGISCPFPTEVDHREIYNAETQEDVTEESGDQ
jgi:hypothetical protein